MRRTEIEPNTEYVAPMSDKINRQQSISHLSDSGAQNKRTCTYTMVSKIVTFVHDCIDYKKNWKYENEKYGRSTVFTSNNYVNA